MEGGGAGGKGEPCGGKEDVGGLVCVTEPPQK
jgi:hypothetical protein